MPFRPTALELKSCGALTAARVCPARQMLRHWLSGSHYSQRRGSTASGSAMIAAVQVGVQSLVAGLASTRVATRAARVALRHARSPRTASNVRTSVNVCDHERRFVRMLLLSRWAEFAGVYNSTLLMLPMLAPSLHMPSTCAIVRFAIEQCAPPPVEAAESFITSNAACSGVSASQASSANAEYARTIGIDEPKKP